MNRLCAIGAAYCAANSVYIVVSAVLLLKGRVLSAFAVLLAGWAPNIVLATSAAWIMSSQNLACQCPQPDAGASCH